MKPVATLTALAAAIALAIATPVTADVTVGITVSATGPAASLGIPQKNTVELLPSSIGGQKINWVVLDDGSDTTKAVTNARKLVAEDRVDVIVGSSTTPNSLAMREVAADSGTPMISLAAAAAIINPTDPKTRWIFKTPQNDSLMADAVAISMKANGIKTMGYIGFADAYGDGWLAEIKRSAQTAGIKIVAEEKYNRNDPSVTGQVLKLMSANPEAILIGAAGTPGATPQKELVARGYKGKIYQTHGVGNPDFLRVVGKDGNGTLLPVGPMLVFEQLPDSNPVKKSAAEYVTKYEQKFGTRTTFGGHLWDAYQMLAKAIPEAQKKAKPGTPQFRTALRDALETSNVVGAHGVFAMNANDHNGLDNRARVMVKIDDGKWVLQK
jgi:branched-chain amino acid transport system substrate-binding protein